MYCSEAYLYPAIIFAIDESFHSYAGVDPEVTMVFNCFPVELHHQIVSFMDPEDILALRKAIHKLPLSGLHS
jgi:hypothetical protein